MEFKIVVLILLIISSLAGSGYIYMKQTKLLSNILLAAYLFGLGLIFINAFNQSYFGNHFTNPFIVYLSLLFFALCLAIPPTAYLYLVSLFQASRSQNFWSHHIKHYVPAGILFIVNTFSFISLFNCDPDSDICDRINSFKHSINFISIFFIFLIQNVYYIFKSYTVYAKRSLMAKNSQNSNQKVALVWMRRFLVSYLLLIIVIYAFQLSWLQEYKYIFRIGLLFYVIFVIYYGRRNYEYVLESKNEEKLDGVKKEAIILELEALMSKEKPFLDSKLTINSLAKMLQTNSKYLSYAINTKYDLNFSSYINRSRIEEAKNLLKSGSYKIYTIESISDMTGFNSKSTFNKAFKRETGMTPTEYRSLREAQIRD